MAKRTIKILLVAIVVLSMVIPLLYIRAAEIVPSKNEALGEINDIVNSLIELKDNPALSSKEKIQEEIRIRKEALIKIIALLISEMDELRTKVGELPRANTQTNQIQLQFTEFLDSARVHTLQFNETLSQELTLTELKERTAVFKTWRNTYYQPRLEMLINFLLVANTQSILSVADHRLEKIITDLKKLESARITRRSEYNPLLNEAMESLTDANLTYYQAEKLIYSVLGTNFLSTTSATTTPTLITTTHIKSLIGQSLNNIRSAYTAFLDISKFVKKRIGK